MLKHGYVMNHQIYQHMKSIIIYSLLAIGMLTITSCKEDDDVKKELAQNTWTFTLDQGYLDKSASSFEMKSIVLNIQGYGQLYAQSKLRSSLGDGKGESGSI